MLNLGCQVVHFSLARLLGLFECHTQCSDLCLHALYNLFKLCYGNTMFVVFIVCDIGGIACNEKVSGGSVGGDSFCGSSVSGDSVNGGSVGGGSGSCVNSRAGRVTGGSGSRVGGDSGSGGTISCVSCGIVSCGSIIDDSGSGDSAIGGSVSGDIISDDHVSCGSFHAGCVTGGNDSGGNDEGVLSVERVISGLEVEVAVFFLCLSALVFFFFFFFWEANERAASVGAEPGLSGRAFQSCKIAWLV